MRWSHCEIWLYPFKISKKSATHLILTTCSFRDIVQHADGFLQRSELVLDQWRCWCIITVAMDHRQGSEKPHQWASDDGLLERTRTLKLKNFYVRAYKPCFFFVIKWDQRFILFCNQRYFNNNFMPGNNLLNLFNLHLLRIFSISLNIRFFSHNFWLKITI